MPILLLGVLLSHSPRPASILGRTSHVTPQGELLLWTNHTTNCPLPFIFFPHCYLFLHNMPHNSNYRVIYLIIFLTPPCKFKHHENRFFFLVHGCIHSAWHLNMSKRVVKRSMKSESVEVARERAGALWGFLSTYGSFPLTAMDHCHIAYVFHCLTKLLEGNLTHFVLAQRMQGKWFWMNEY